MKALLVFKQSLLERIGNQPVIRTLSAKIRAQLVKSDQENRNAIHDVFYTLIENHLDVDLVSRADIKKTVTRDKYDLVVAVGGDGTLFHVAHYVRGVPCLLVNSEPANSVGIFSSCTRTDFARHIRSFLKGTYTITRINRGKIVINNKEIPQLFTNDVLISDSNPASIYKFEITVDGRKTEYIESSGIWVSTAAGSTAAIFAAGGSIMKLQDDRLQYLVREPYYYKTDAKNVKGFGKSMQIRALSPNGFIFMDGPRSRHKIDMGSLVAISVSEETLKLVNYSDKTRRRVIARIK